MQLRSLSRNPLHTLLTAACRPLEDADKISELEKIEQEMKEMEEKEEQLRGQGRKTRKEEGDGAVCGVAQQGACAYNNL